MKKSLSYTLLFCLTSLFGISIYGCGDDGASSFTADPKSGSTISVSDKIIITFNGDIAHDSVTVGGSMATLADTASWSGRVLTISPKDKWDGGESGTLSIKASTLAEETENYGFQVNFTKFQKASIVIGQPDFVSSASGTSTTSLNGPFGMPAVTDEGKLIFTDTENSRVLIYNKIPTTNNASANLVVGQPDFTTTTTGQAANEMDRPESVIVANGKLFVKDYSNDRILVFNNVPTANHASANLVIGQTGFNVDTTVCDNKTLQGPEGFWIVGGKLLVADSNNNRVLIWNTIPTTNGKAADLVLGQGDFTHCTDNDANQDDAADANPSNKTLSYPSNVWSDGTKLIVTDSDNNRVLIWNTFPTSNFAKADVVLGQNSFSLSTNDDDNQDGTADLTTSARTLDFPYYMYSNGTQLFIDDDSNSRILVWNKIPTTNFTKADVVLGQNSFTNQASDDDNQDGTPDANPSARTFGCPEGIKLYKDQLIVADDCSSRVVIFKE